MKIEVTLVIYVEIPLFVKAQMRRMQRLGDGQRKMKIASWIPCNAYGVSLMGLWSDLDKMIMIG